MARNKVDVWPLRLKNLRNAKGKRVFRGGWGPQGQHPVQMQGTLYSGEQVYFRAGEQFVHLDIHCGPDLKTYRLPVHKYHKCTPNSLKRLDQLPKPGQPFCTKHRGGAGAMKQSVASRLICRWVKEYLAGKK